MVASPDYDDSRSNGNDSATPPVSVTRIVLLLGGDSAEREISLRSGAEAADALRSIGYEVVPFDPSEIPLDHFQWRAGDVCFIALHGAAGEDGRVQQWLQTRGILYTGSGPAASRCAMRKAEAKARWQQAGLLTPEWVLVRCDQPWEDQLAAAQLPPLPLVVKPDDQGSSIGLRLVRNIAELREAVIAVAQISPFVLIERFVSGREITATLLGGRPLPLIEITATDAVFDYQAKYSSSATQCLLPAPLEPMIAEEVNRTAAAAAAALGTVGLVRIDLRLDEQQRPWLLEANTIPGLTRRSLAPRAAQAAGIELPQLCDWMIRDAVARAARDRARRSVAR